MSREPSGSNQTTKELDKQNLNSHTSPAFLWDNNRIADILCLCTSSPFFLVPSTVPVVSKSFVALRLDVGTRKPLRECCRL